jgi:prevent-host-death family protein
MQTLFLTEVKARLSQLADEVDRTDERVQVTRNGREFVALISSEDLAFLEATIALLSDPDAMARISEADAAVVPGDPTSGEEMGVLMEARRRSELKDGQKRERSDADLPPKYELAVSPSVRRSLRENPPPVSTSGQMDGGQAVAFQQHATPSGSANSAELRRLPVGLSLGKSRRAFADYRAPV